MTFQKGDHVLYDGQICRVRYANHEVVVFARIRDEHLMMQAPDALAREQEPWIRKPGNSWWTPMSILNQ